MGKVIVVKQGEHYGIIGDIDGCATIGENGKLMVTVFCSDNISRWFYLYELARCAF